jgi:hypothetical protein
MTAANIVWNNTYGGPGFNTGQSLISTSDNGFAITGSMAISPNNKTIFYNTSSMYLIKTDANGTLLWSKTYGNEMSGGVGLVQTSDGGYAILGSIGSLDKVILVKTDASGNEVWNNTYSGENNDYISPMYLAQTRDGGYIITGGTGRTISEFMIYLIKTDADGKIIWNKTIGPGTGFFVTQTPDGGYVIATNALSASTALLKPSLIKTDGNGNIVWNKTYSPVSYNKTQLGNTSDGITLTSSAMQTSDGGFALAGTTGIISIDMADGSSGTTVNKNVSSTINTKGFLIKTDAEGNEVWSNTYGVTGDNEVSSAIQSSDGGYALVGTGIGNSTISVTTSYTTNKSSIGTQFNISTITPAVFFVKTDVNGNELWSKTFYGLSAKTLVESGDGGYVITGDKTMSSGTFDILLAKIA